MADVFISYKSERRAAAEHFAEILNDYGYTVWWDYGLVSGRDFGAQIESELRTAKAVVVLWCSLSVGSEWVREEAALAKRLNKIIPTFIEQVDLPLGFSLSQTLDLSDWDGAPQSNKLERLLRDIAGFVGRPPNANLEGLDRTERAWRRFGAPPLSQFALIDELERKYPPRTLPSGLSSDTGKLTDEATPPDTPPDNVHISFSRDVLKYVVGGAIVLGISLFLLRYTWFALIPLYVLMSVAFVLAGNRLHEATPRIARVFLRLPWMMLKGFWGFLTKPRWKWPRRALVALLIFSVVIGGALFAYPTAYRAIEGSPLNAEFVASRQRNWTRSPGHASLTFYDWSGGVLQLSEASSSGITTQSLQTFDCPEPLTEWISANKLYGCGSVLEVNSSEVVRLPIDQALGLPGELQTHAPWRASSDGSRLIVWTDLDAAVFDTDTGAIVAARLGDNPTIWTNARFSPTGNRVALMGRRNTLRVWDLAANAEVFSTSVEDPVRGAFMSPNGELLYYLLGNSLFQVEVSSGQTQEIAFPGTQTNTAIEIHEDAFSSGTFFFFYGGRRVLFYATSGQSGACSYYALNTELGSWISHNGSCNTYQTRYITELPGDHIRIGNAILRSENLLRPEWGSDCWSADLSADGTRAACSNGGEVQIISTSDGAVVGSVADVDPLTSWYAISTPRYYHLSPDGQRIVTVDTYNVVRIRRVSTGEVLNRFVAPLGIGYAGEFPIAFDEHWQTAVAMDADTVEVWRLSE